MNINDFKVEEYQFINYVNLSDDFHKQVHAVRNLESVRQYMVNDKPFSFENHRNFVKLLANDNNKIYWAVCENHDFICSISLHPIEWEQKYAEWGIYMNPNFAGKGIAKRIALLFFTYITNLGCFRLIKAKVRKNNAQSYYYHKSIGFITTSADDTYYMMEKILGQNE